MVLRLMHGAVAICPHRLGWSEHGYHCHNEQVSFVLQEMSEIIFRASVLDAAAQTQMDMTHLGSLLRDIMEGRMLGKAMRG